MPTGVGAPVVGVVLQEARRISLIIARTIQRWWNWLGDWSRWYIQILSPFEDEQRGVIPQAHQLISQRILSKCVRHH